MTNISSNTSFLDGYVRQSHDWVGFQFGFSSTSETGLPFSLYLHFLSVKKLQKLSVVFPSFQRDDS